MSGSVLRLGTRGSALAMAQSQLVADAVIEATGRHVELVRIRTEGDVNLAPLTSIGGTGVFVTAVRQALLHGEVDLVVHSFKDLPTDSASGLTLGAVPQREPHSDALCANGSRLADLPAGARIGTGSPRRAGQLRRLRPDVQVVPIRGNVDTRLNRVRSGELAGVLLATAGLCRLGLTSEIDEELTAPDLLPAPAQGALAVEIRQSADNDDAANALSAAVATIEDRKSRWAALAERGVLRRLAAGCSAPVSALAVLSDGQLSVAARVTRPNGSAELTVTAEGAFDLRAERADGDRAAESVGTQAAEQLLAAGAADLVDGIGG